MKRNRETGFTVIETIIVIAVAGLIFLIIFNAIPALIRNGRNDQHKQDVAAVLDAISQYQLRNSGSVPADYATLTTDPFTTSGVGTVKLSYYDSSSVFINGGDCVGTVNASNVTIDKLVVCNSHICDPSTPQAVKAGAGYRDIVAVYDIETASGTSVKCQQL